MPFSCNNSFSGIDEEELPINVIVKSNRNDNVSLQLFGTNLKVVDPVALIDSGAQGRFVDESIVKRDDRRKLLKKITVRNVDGTRNNTGSITEETRVKYWIENQYFDEWFLVTSLGDQQIILGMPWLEQHNPKVDWEKKTVKMADENRGRSEFKINQLFSKMKNEKDDVVINRITYETDFEERILASFDHEDTWLRIKTITDYLEGIEDESWVRVKQTFSQKFSQAAEAKKKTGEKTQLPKEYAQYASVFGKQESERLPEHRPWDLEIKLKADHKPYAVKQPYKIPPNIEPYFDKWLDENLKKGYIRPSSLEHAAGLFFVGKQKGKEPRPCMDYRMLNKGTICDVYPLPLISDLLLKLRGMKYFTKLNLRWGYNNICMKPGSEKYAAFKTP